MKRSNHNRRNSSNASQMLESLEGRQMFAATLVSTAGLTTKTPSPGVVVNVAVSTQNFPKMTTNPQNLFAPRIEGMPSMLPGGLPIILDPAKRPDRATFPTSGIQSILETRFDSLLNEFGGSNFNNSANVTDAGPSKGPGIQERVQTMLDGLRAFANSNAGRTSQQMEGDGATPPATPPATDTPTDSGAKKTEEKSTFRKVVDVLVDYFKSVVLEKYGPPGPADTILGAPEYVGKVTGHPEDLPNGVKAIAERGNITPEMYMYPKNNTPTPDDVIISAQTRKVIDQILAIAGPFYSPRSVRQAGTTLISTPREGSVFKHDIETLKNQTPPKQNVSNEINPTRVDDGSGAGGQNVEVIRKTPAVKDPPRIGSGLDTPTTPGATPGTPGPVR